MKKILALLLIGLMSKNTYANKSMSVEELAQKIQKIQNQSDSNKMMDDLTFDYPVFKTLQLTNMLGIPGYQRLHFPVYKSLGTQGPGILLVHGNSSSSRSYVFQMFSLLGAKYKMYLIDMPGLGNSEKVDANRPFPVNPATGVPVGFSEYTIGMIEAVATAANDPDINAKIVVGWSLGGDVTLLTRGIGLLPNVKGIMMFGTAPTGQQVFTTQSPFLPPNVPGLPLAVLPSFGFNFQFNANSPFGFSLDLQFTDPVPAYATPPLTDAPNVGQAYIRSFFNNFRRLNGLVPPFFIEDGFNRTDSRHRSSLGATILFPTPGLLPDELQVLQSLRGNPNDPNDDVALAIVAGSEDAFVNNQYLAALATSGLVPTLWRGAVQTISGAGHAAHFDRPLQFNYLLNQFINDATK